MASEVAGEGLGKSNPTLAILSAGKKWHIRQLYLHFSSTVGCVHIQSKELHRLRHLKIHLLWSQQCYKVDILKTARVCTLKYLAVVIISTKHTTAEVLVVPSNRIKIYFFLFVVHPNMPKGP